MHSEELDAKSGISASEAKGKGKCDVMCLHYVIENVMSMQCNDVKRCVMSSLVEP